MAFYTEVLFSTDHLTLKSYQESVTGQQVLLEEKVIPRAELENQLKVIAHHFPKIIKIRLQPEEMVYKNIKSTVQNEKLMTQAVHYESLKYFRLCQDDFCFTYHIWKKDTGGVWITLLGVHRNLLEQYLPLIRAGFIPCYEIADFISRGKELKFLTKKIGPEKESFRVYYEGSLICWKVYSKKSAAETKTKVIDYIKNIGLPYHGEKENNKKVSLQNKVFLFSSGLLESDVKLSLKKRFWLLSAAFVSILTVIFISCVSSSKSTQKKRVKIPMG